MMPAPDPGPAVATTAPRVAVLVAHGMGQQVPFETLDHVARLVREEACAGGAPDRTQVDLVPIPGDAPSESGELPRVRMTVPGADGAPRTVDLYEIYWAPLAEGRITLAETFGFLWSSTLDGLAAALRGSFARWMFGRWRRFRVPRRDAVSYAAILVFLAALLVLNAVVAAVGASLLVGRELAGWPGPALLADLTLDILAGGVAAGVLLAIGIGGPAWARRARAPGDRRPVAAAVTGLGWVATMLGLAALVATASLLVAHVASHVPARALPLWEFGPFAGLAHYLAGSRPTPLRTAALFLPWTLVVLLDVGFRQVLLQSVGDVAIYVSSHRVNRFSETRQAIQRAADRVVAAVYAMRPAYDRVIVVGHSLGSVIAYDALNRALRRAARPGSSLGDVAGRTSMFVTFGSPLDKTAFVFRAQARDLTDVRERLAAAKQPMIEDDAARPARWVNLYSPNDWISARLDLYDRPPGEATPGERRVDNREDPQATTPLLAHNEYWAGDLLPEILHAEITRA